MKIKVEKQIKNIFEFLIEKESSELSKQLVNAQAFEISIIMEPRYNSSSFEGFTENAPPMPFIIGPFACYDRGPEISILVKDSQGNDHMFDIENTLDAIELTLSLNEEGIIEISCNNKSLLTKKIDKPQYSNKVSLGVGYKKRFWKGIIKDLIVTLEGQNKIEITNESMVKKYFEIKEFAQV